MIGHSKRTFKNQNWHANLISFNIYDLRCYIILLCSDVFLRKNHKYVIDENWNFQGIH
jgi:hypothetical protein